MSPPLVLNHDNQVAPAQLADTHLSPHVQLDCAHLHVPENSMGTGSHASDNVEIIVELEGNNKVRSRSGRNRLAAVLVVLVVLLTLIVVLCITVKAKVVMVVLDDKLIVPDTDTRDYRVIKLTNSIVVTLVSDPETRTASTSFNVGIGSVHNPDEVLGLAHFLEHMLFMGSKKYPTENEADKYASLNDGWINAWTDDTNTNYHFLVRNDALYNMTDIYAQFFIDPLLEKEPMEREMQAVESEYDIGASSDFWPQYQLTIGNSNPECPYSRLVQI